MAVFRVERTKDYTVMSNHHLRNKTLSLKAKGLQSLMLSLPENWDFTLAGLAFICQDGISSVRSGVAELEKHGYLTRRRIREHNGQLTLKEAQLLELLIHRKNMITSKELIIEKLWGYDTDTEDSHVEYHVSLLRKKLMTMGASVSIITVRGAGYALKESEG